MGHGEALDSREITFEVAAGNAKSGREIAEFPDAAVELERRHNLRPNRADLFAQFGKGVRDLMDATRHS